MEDTRAVAPWQHINLLCLPKVLWIERKLSVSKNDEKPDILDNRGKSLGVLKSVLSHTKLHASEPLQCCSLCKECPSNPRMLVDSVQPSSLSVLSSVLPFPVLPTQTGSSFPCSQVTTELVYSLLWAGLFQS